MDLDADLTLRGVARIVADLIEALELRDVTMVGNDTGGAICQVVISEHPERLAQLTGEFSEEVVNRPPVARGNSQEEGSSGD